MSYTFLWSRIQWNSSNMRGLKILFHFIGQMVSKELRIWCVQGYHKLAFLKEKKSVEGNHTKMDSGRESHFWDSVMRVLSCLSIYVWKETGLFSNTVLNVPMLQNRRKEILSPMLSFNFKLNISFRLYPAYSSLSHKKTWPIWETIMILLLLLHKMIRHLIWERIN